MKNYVITIARGFGSGGKALGMRLAEELGIACYENRILALASKITGKDTAELIEIDEKLRSGIFNAILRSFPTRKEPNPVLKKFESDEEIFQTQCEIIKELAKKESCIIIGKCADYVLKDFDNVASFNVNEAEAAKLIEKTDKYRADYYEYYTNGNYWTNPVNYDMTFNMDRIGEDKCVEVIKNYIKLKFGNEVFESKPEGDSPNLYTFAEDKK